MRWTQDHVAFRVGDIEAAIRFYRDRVGLKLMFQEVDPVHHEAFAFLELEGGNLELLETLDENNKPIPYSLPPLDPPYCPHLALRTGDLEAVIRLLAREKIPVLKGPLEIPGQVRWLYVADPDHNVLEFVQWLRDETDRIFNNQ